MARGRSGRRGTYDWGGFVFGSTTLSSTQVILGSLVDIEAITIVRLRGEILIKGTPDAIADDAVVGLGMIVVSDASAAVGGVSVPGPIADLGAPWVWHRFVSLAAGSTGLLGDDLGSVVRVMVDSKAMRKLGPAESLILVGETSTNDYSVVSANGGIRGLSLHS